MGNFSSSSSQNQTQTQKTRTLADAITAAVNRNHSGSTFSASEYQAATDLEIIRQYVTSVRIAISLPLFTSPQRATLSDNDSDDTHRFVELRVAGTSKDQLIRDLLAECTRPHTRINSLVIEFRTAPPLWTDLSTLTNLVKTAPSLTRFGYTVRETCCSHQHTYTTPEFPGEKELLAQVAKQRNLRWLDFPSEFASVLAEPLFYDRSMAKFESDDPDRIANPNATWRLNLFLFLTHYLFYFFASSSFSSVVGLPSDIIQLLNQLTDKLTVFPHWVLRNESQHTRFQDLR